MIGKIFDGFVASIFYGHHYFWGDPFVRCGQASVFGSDESGALIDLSLHPAFDPGEVCTIGNAKCFRIEKPYSHLDTDDLSKIQLVIALGGGCS